MVPSKFIQYVFFAMAGIAALRGCLTARVLVRTMSSRLQLASTLGSASRKQHTATEVKTYIALGSNIGDRSLAINNALSELRKLGKLSCTSFLYETQPMYHIDQPRFLNAACCLETSLQPTSLLNELKQIEDRVGRQQTFRNGPRVIDLDILMYGNESVLTDTLAVPHPRIAERSFVVQPLFDIKKDLSHPRIAEGMTVEDMWRRLSAEGQFHGMRRVIPVYNHKDKQTRMLDFNFNESSPEESLSDSGGPKPKLPLLMGILNVTPDSFSDGGVFDNDMAKAIAQALQLVKDGATVLDIGGESTRPGATTIDTEQEINRVVPVIEAIRAAGCEALISIDTRKAAVADAAIRAGADMVNDVSAGTFDPDMLPVVGALQVPYIAMHMRGSPKTMLESQHCQYGADIVATVASELTNQLDLIDQYIPRWLQMIDPGIGFAKGYEENMILLQPCSLKRLKKLLHYRPMLVGLSRKRFLSRIDSDTTSQRSLHQARLLWPREDFDSSSISARVGSEVDSPLQSEASQVQQASNNLRKRDLATAGACCAAIMGKADMLRVHNVADVRAVCDTFVTISKADYTL